MRDDFDTIPDPVGRHDAPGTMLTRIYHDVGLAAVAEALNLLTVDFDPDLKESLERGEFYLFPGDPGTARDGALEQIANKLCHTPRGRSHLCIRRICRRRASALSSGRDGSLAEFYAKWPPAWRGRERAILHLGQGGEGGRLDVAVRYGGSQSRSGPAASLAFEQDRRKRRLVDEDEFHGIETESGGEPVPAPLQNVRAPLLRSVRGNNLLTRVQVMFMIRSSCNGELACPVPSNPPRPTAGDRPRSP